MKFNQIQQQILELNSGTHIIQAPAGCGKTEVLTKRVSNALENGQAPESMICLTFTNRAASEMKERSQIATVFIGNIHNYCTLYLKSNNFLKGSSTILDDSDYKEIISGISSKTKRIFEKEKSTLPNFDNGTLYKFITEQTRILNGLETTDPDFFYNQTKELEAFFKQVTSKFIQVKNEYNFIDFDDLLTFTLVHLNQNKGEQKLAHFDWIQVDEVQDLNSAQWEIIELISKNAKNKLLFGDYDQSIYSFMGANQARFISLLDQFPMHYLNENYRSTHEMKLLLNAYLNKTLGSKQQFDVTKVPSISATSKFEILQKKGLESEEYEDLVSKHLSKKINEEGITAVLVKSNGQADKISTELKNLGISHYMLSGQDFFDYEDVKNALAILRVQQNKFDLISWSRLYRRFTSNNTIEQARSFINRALKNGFLPSDFFQTKITSTIERFVLDFRNERIVVFDTETTSLDTDNAEVIQIAAVELINGEKGREFEVYIKTDSDISSSQSVHQISKETLLEKGLEPELALQQFLDFIGPDSAILAHNLDYDYAVMVQFCKRYNCNFEKFKAKSHDSLIMSRMLFPQEKSHKLGDLLERFELAGSNTHNALDDVRATVNLVQFIATKTENVVLASKVFYELEEKQINTFSRNFSSIFNSIKNQFYSEFSLCTWMESFCKQSFQTLDLNDPRIESFIKILDSKKVLGQSLRMHIQNNLMYYTGLKEVDLMDEKRKIVVATIHKSKGLAFDSVYLPAVVNNQFPHYFDQTPAQILEAKRLFYVALSRAKRNITLSYHTDMITKNGQTYKVKLSGFVNDIRSYFTETDV